MESLLPWVLFSLVWWGNDPPSAAFEGIYYSSAKCHEAAAHIHEVVGSSFLKSDAYPTKRTPSRREYRCKQVDVNKLLAPYAGD